MKRSLIAYSLLTAAASSAMLLTGCGQQANSQQAAQMPPATVTVVEMKTEEVTTTRELPGRTVSYQVAEVRPQVDGIIEERLFEEGGYVEEGQPLYQIDDAIYQARYNMAKASVEAARSAADLAEVNSKRATDLYEANAISKQEYDNATATLKQSVAQLGVAESEMASAAVTLEYSRIEAPISGQIGKSSVTKGALVTANQSDALATVHQLDPIYVDVTQSSRELLRLRKAIAQGETKQAEMPVKILLEDGSTYDHDGELAFSEVAVDPTTGSYTLRVIVPNPDQVLMPGMYVRAVLGEGIHENGILVPQGAVSRSPTGSTSVLIVTSDNTVESRAVEIGQSVGNKWLVRNGLMAGDRVVVKGLQKARPGSKVYVETQANAQVAE